jgi:hypothetical protein
MFFKISFWWRSCVVIVFSVTSFGQISKLSKERERRGEGLSIGKN